MTSRRRLVHITSVHPAGDTRILHKEGKSLVKAGFDVSLIAAVDGTPPSSFGGVQLIQFPRRKSRLKRALLSSGQMLIQAIRAHGDAYHFHDPELLPVGLILKVLGKRVVFDIHEHVDKQIRSKSWIPGPLREPIARFYSLVERFSVSAFDGVVVADPTQAAQYATHPVCVVENFPIVEEIDSDAAAQYRKRDHQVAYVGGLTELRGVTEMVDALELANESTLVTLKLAGRFSPPTLQENLQVRAGWRHVHYAGQLDRDEVAGMLVQSRIGLVVLHPIPNYLTSQPVKLLEYMLAELPVVVCDFPYYRQYVEDHKCGLMVDPMNPQEIADAIVWLLNHPDEAEAMGKRGRTAVLANYTWESQAEKLVNFYRTIILA